MKTLIQIPALVEATSSDDMVTASINLSTKDGQTTIEIPEWDTRLEVSTEHLAKAMAELSPSKASVSPTLVQHLGQKLSRLEQQVAATPQQRLELEALGENLEAIRREVLLRMVVVETWKGRIEALEKNHSENDASIVALEETAQNFGDRITLLENGLDSLQNIPLDHVADPDADAATALYGGEQ